MDKSHHLAIIPYTPLRSVRPVNDETSPQHLTIIPYTPSAHVQTYNSRAPPPPLMAAIPLQTAPAKRKRGRPPGSKNLKTTKRPKATDDAGPSTAPVKRGRGRPPGSKNSKPKTTSPLPLVVYNSSYAAGRSTAPTKRKRGPPKGSKNSKRTKKAKTNDDAGPSTAPVKRGRGRPPGTKNSKTETTSLALVVYNAACQAKNSKKPKADTPRLVISCPHFESGISEAERETGNEELTSRVLMQVDAVRRRLFQLGYAEKALTTAPTNCKNLGVRTNMKKRIGPVPGIKVGDIFYFWGEMRMVGLHTQTTAGIDYLTGSSEGHLATSIVTSGHYGDKTEDPQVLIYTGHGGKDKNGQPVDQKLVKGNLALVTSRKKGNVVRVIRGIKDPSNKNKKIYIYDGLYTVSHDWKAFREGGCSQFKFRLVRKPDQPCGYAIWKSAEKLRKNLLSDTRLGFLLKDISKRAEVYPIPVVNEVDEEDKTIPQGFSYTTSLDFPIQPLSVTFTTPRSTGCVDCRDKSCCSAHNCVCVQRNGGELPYLDRILVCRKPMVYECGYSCPCPLDCENRVVQTGIKIRLEVFKTINCGWGLRSWEPIRAGTFICEFAGKIKEEEDDDDEYEFDTSRFYNRVKWNYEPELVGEDVWEQVSEVFKLPRRILISAKKYGNVGRFMNHSCSPNVMWQPIECERNGEPCLRIGFFAMKHIPPLEELRYDYGVYVVEELGGDDKLLKGKKTCLCGSLYCRGSFGKMVVD